MTPVTVRAIDHGFGVELQLEREPERMDRVAAWHVDGILVDTGGARTAAELAEWVGRRRTDAIFLGHWHEDHTGGAARLASTGIPLYGSRGTAGKLRRPPPIPDYRATLWGQIEPASVRSVPGDAPLRATPLPGHAPDQLGYLHERSGVLFSGDLALRRDQKVAMPGEDPWTSMASMRAVIDLQPAALATSHRSLLRDWQPFLRAQLTYLEELAAAILHARSQGRTVTAIVDEVFGGEASCSVGPGTWREWTGGEFSTARWVSAFLKRAGPPSVRA
jgi:glyoxylase-like metal-dependent hydrolase (beta-lactamase superfamily II)